MATATSKPKKRKRVAVKNAGSRHCSVLLSVMPDRKPMASPVSIPITPRKRRSTDKNEGADNGRWKRRRELEQKLWAEFKDNPTDELRNKIWVHYQPLVQFLAVRLKSKLPEWVDLQDLIGAGNLGLQAAIRKFNSDLGVRFETYAVSRVRGAMVDAVRRQDWVPRLIRHRNHRLERLIQEMERQLGHAPTEEEISARLGIDPMAYAQLKKELELRAFVPAEEGGDDNGRDSLRLEMVEDRRTVHPSTGLEREEIHKVAAAVLTTVENLVIRQYYFGERSMKQIGEELQVSESRVCQIHTKALTTLRRKLKAYGESCRLGG